MTCFFGIFEKGVKKGFWFDGQVNAASNIAGPFHSLDAVHVHMWLLWPSRERSNGVSFISRFSASSMIFPPRSRSSWIPHSSVHNTYTGLLSMLLAKHKATTMKMTAYENNSNSDANMRKNLYKPKFARWVNTGSKTLVSFLFQRNKATGWGSKMCTMHADGSSLTLTVMLRRISRSA